MATLLTARATEGSTYVVTVPFEDEDGNPVVPKTVTWTLTDGDGQVVNSRHEVIETPAASLDIVLTDGDLPADGYLVRMLYLLVEATYDSALGSDLPLKVQCQIEVLAVEAEGDDPGS